MRPNLPNAITRTYQGKIIWPCRSTRDENLYALFRKPFEMKSGGSCRIFLSADTWYNLYVDGVFIHRGPARAFETNYTYDELSLSLSAGKHLVAVLVHYIGRACATHRVAAKAFFADVVTDQETIGTDESWKAITCEAYRATPKMISHFGFPEDVDMRRYPDGWTDASFDDSAWDQAQVLSDVGGDCHQNLTARQLQLFHYVRQPGQVLTTGCFEEAAGEPEPDGYAGKVLRRVRQAGQTGGAGSYAVADFAVSCSGTVEICYENARDNCELIVSYDDLLQADGTVNPRRATSGYADRFVLKAGSGSVMSAMARGFRYVMVDVTGNCRIKSITAVKEEYPYSEGRPFAASDPWLNTLYDQSARTQRVCTIDGFTDCVTRERVLWLGDAYMDCLGLYYAEPDSGLLLDTIYKHAHSQRDSGSLGGYTMSDLNPDWICMISYNLMWLQMLLDYASYTGDIQSLEPLDGVITRLMDYLKSRRNKDGIIDTAMGGSGFWDWGFSELDGQLLMSNAYFIFTVERLYQHPYFQRYVDNALYAEIQIMKEKCRRLFYDEEQGLYKDAIRPDGSGLSLHSQSANALAILSGICPKEQQAELVARILNPDNLGAIAVGERPEDTEKISPDLDKVNPVSTMFGGLFVCQSLFSAGFPNEALALLRDVWGPFEQLPTLPELRINGSNNTMCHGWSGAPAFLLPMSVLGLRPGQDGWAEAVFEPPMLAEKTLSCAKGVVKTPRGVIKAQWVRLAKGIKLLLDLPDGIKGTIKWNGREYSCEQTGSQTLYLLD